MPGISIYLDRPPNSARLVAWGRAPDAWWGCVQFRQPVMTPDGRHEIDIAAWVPAASITRPGWSAPTPLPRLQLSHDRTTWPAPPGWPSWYAGVWPIGPLSLPPGIVIDARAAWRRKR